MSINRSGCALTGDWNKLRSFLRSGQDYIDGVNEILEDEANKIKKAVQEEIPFNSVPNAPSTIKRKGANSPLLETGTLRDKGIVVNEYSSRDRNYKKYYVIQGDADLLVNTRGRTGKDLLNYAQLLEIMENGGSGLGKGETYIPPRPVLSITFDRYSNDLESEIIHKVWQKVHVALKQGRAK